MTSGSGSGSGSDDELAAMRDPRAHPAPGPGDPTCPHIERLDGVCAVCGHCAHEIVVNGACLYCRSTDLDAIAMSPKPAALISADRLRRRRDPS